MVARLTLTCLISDIHVTAEKSCHFLPKPSRILIIFYQAYQTFIILSLDISIDLSRVLCNLKTQPISSSMPNRACSAEARCLARLESLTDDNFRKGAEMPKYHQFYKRCS